MRCQSVRPANSFSVRATRASVGNTGWQAVKIRRSRSSPISSARRIELVDEVGDDYIVVHELCHLRHRDHSAAFWNDMTMGSAWASCLDIGGKYSGIVAGCMNTVGNLGGAVAGFMTGRILKNYGDELGWQVNFFVFGCVYVLATLFWLRFDSTRPVFSEPESR